MGRDRGKAKGDSLDEQQVPDKNADPIKGRDLSALTVSTAFSESQLSGDLLKWYAQTRDDFAKAMPGSPALNPGLSDPFGSVLRGGIREAYSRVGLKYFRAMLTLFRYTGDKAVLDLVYEAALIMMDNTGNTTFTIGGKTFVTWPTDILLPDPVKRTEPNYLANKEAHSSFLVAAMVAWTLYVNRKLDRRYLPLVDRLNRFCEDQEEIFRLGTGKSVDVDDLLHMTTQAGLDYCHYTALMKETLPSSRSAELSYYQGHIKNYTAEFFNSCEFDSMGGVPVVYWSHRMASKVRGDWEVQMGLYPVGTASNIIEMHYSGYPEFSEDLLRRINAAWAVARYRPGSTYTDEYGNITGYDLSAGMQGEGKNDDGQLIGDGGRRVQWKRGERVWRAPPGSNVNFRSEAGRVVDSNLEPIRVVGGTSYSDVCPWNYTNDKPSEGKWYEICEAQFRRSGSLPAGLFSGLAREVREY